MKKRLLSLALVLVMCFGLTIPALADDTWYIPVITTFWGNCIIDTRIESVPGFGTGQQVRYVKSGCEVELSFDSNFYPGSAGEIQEISLSVVGTKDKIYYYERATENVPFNRTTISFTRGQTKDGKTIDLSDSNKVYILTVQAKWQDGMEDSYNQFFRVVNEVNGEYVINDKAVYTNPLIVIGGLDYDYMIPIGISYTSDTGYTGFEVMKDGKYGFLDELGNEIIPPVLEYDDVTSLDDEHYRVRKDGKYGLLDSKGNEIVPPIYDAMGKISGGMLRVEQNIDDTGSRSRKYGFVNVSTGELAIPIQYDSSPKSSESHTEISNFSNGVAVICYIETSYIGDYEGTHVYTETHKNGLIDKKRNMVIPVSDINISYSPEWTSFWAVGMMVTPSGLGYNFSDDRVVVSSNGKWTVLDTRGNILFKPDFDSTSGYVNGLAIVSKNGKEGCIDTQGNVVVPLEYDSINQICDGYIIASKNGKEGCVDIQGNVVVPLKYDYVREFCNGYAIVGQNGKYGAVNQQGELVVPTIYDVMMNFSEDMASVGISAPNSSDGYKYGFVNTSGKLVVPTIYDSIHANTYGLGEFHDGLAHVAILDERFSEITRAQNKHGYIDKQGNVVIPIIYDNAWDFSNGFALAEIGVDGTGIDRYRDGSPYEAIMAKFKELGIETECTYIDATGKALYSSPRADYGVVVRRFYVDQSNGKYAIMRNPLYKETATPTRSTVLVNGEKVAFDAYTINQNNYFKLRDLAKVLSGTDKQFEVTWDGTNNTINMLSGKPYTTVGGELAQGDGINKTASINTATIYLDGQPVSLLAYTINENNYFKLRDVGIALDFDVTWDGVNNTIVIDTTRSYTPD